MKKEVYVPDIGDYSNVDVIDVAVKDEDIISVDDTLITLETDKATMDVPSPVSGKVIKVHVAIGNKVSKGSLILTVDVGEQDDLEDKHEQTDVAVANKTETTNKPKIITEIENNSTTTKMLASQTEVYAGPGVRRFARELGVDLNKVNGSGRKNRILKIDVQNYVKQALQNASSNNSSNLGLDLPPMPDVDFAKFGDIEEKPLSRIKKISGSYLHRNWVHIPHVTHFDEADITKLEQFKKSNKQSAESKKVKLTPLIFVMKAIVCGLQSYAQFNSSVDIKNGKLILKKYFNIGIAVDTPNGLVVPVVKEVDKKDVFQLANELGEISKKARDGKLTASDMQGGCFSISSLGGIGGTAFTPIINAPEVAILGVSRSRMQPKFIDGKFEPRLMMPLSLSYDHRVIDGAEAARFMKLVVNKLEGLDF